MPAFALAPVEARVLGCLLEKERTTPESYPLSMNGLVNAANQLTNREPVTAYDERTVEEAVSTLREKKLVTVIFGAGSRVQKYRHNLLDHFTLDRRDIALLCTLLLRGPQTPGELRARSERMAPFATLEELEGCLSGMAAGAAPLVRLLPAQAGQKERRYVQLLSAQPEEGSVSTAASPRQIPLPTAQPAAPADEGLRSELAEMRRELEELKQQFAEFRRQFE